ncbi:MAG TPA: amino acid permease, partial [Isosphaeraceae bacterium]|nr:amino acid permease [Isosphaeraceae bacterium]
MSTHGRAPDHTHDLPRVLGPMAALGTIVGSVIGSGIFIVPASVARQTPAMGPIALAWVLGGLFSLAGALTLAELAAMLPRAGGPYVYLKEAYGDLPAFLFGWTEFLIIRSGSMATLAAAFSLYFAQIVPAPGSLDPRIWQMFAAVVAIAVVAVVNVLGTRWGGRLQVFGTTLKVGALGAMIVLPWVLGKAHVSHLSPVWPAPSKGFFTH